MLVAMQFCQVIIQHMETLNDHSEAVFLIILTYYFCQVTNMRTFQ